PRRHPPDASRASATIPATTPRWCCVHDGAPTDGGLAVAAGSTGCHWRPRTPAGSASRVNRR
ncbi:MAG: hypothetical protein ACO37V_04470, partial [Ilumatobacteraceae bacterium]